MKAIPYVLSAVAVAAAVSGARADVITDWNLKTADFVTEAKLGTPPAIRLMALVQTAAHGAVASAPRGASVDAAVVAAHRTMLTKMLPAQLTSIDAAAQPALAAVPDGSAKAAGIAAGEKAAADVLARRLDDGASTPEAYRPHAAPGVYVPTAPVAIPQWSQRKPWLMAGASHFRPAPPPALSSAQWAREYNEVKDFGGRAATRRGAEQTDVARFWDYSLPNIYYGVVRSVALQPGRDVAHNARLFAAVAQAMDDAMIGVFDAKYHYGFWRPVTAIRNGDTDGNDATARDAAWASLIDAPMHPEYPSGHSILAATVATVLKAEIGSGPMPVLATSSPTAKGATRRWNDLDEFVREVSNARIWGGIHFRAATQAGEAMGRRIGELAVQRFDAAP